ncbi:hypothetical protein [Mesorhizobium abyssinicae]
MAGGELDVDQAMATFARVDVDDLREVERPVSDCPHPADRIVVAFANGARLRIDRDRRSGSAAYRPGGVEQVITVVPTDRIFLCCGATYMRRGINSLARMVQQVLALDPHLCVGRDYVAEPP